MAWLALAGIAFASFLLLIVLGAILSWLLWLAQMVILFVTIPYYLGRALVSGVRWTFGLARPRKAKARAIPSPWVSPNRR